MKSNKKIKRKNNIKGITLIALVITIIVLLILAGVSIAILTGQGNILDNAGTARDKTNESEDIEKIQFALNEYKLETHTGNTDKSLADYLKSKDWCTDATENDDGTIDVIVEGSRKYQISADYLLGKIDENKLK